MELRKRRIGEAGLNFVLDNRSLAILVVEIIVASFISPYFFGFINIRNVIRQVAVSCILATGFTLVIGAGYMDLSVGCQLGLLGAIMAKLSKAGLPVWLVLIIGLALGACTGSVNAILINTFNLPFFIVTLSTASVYRGITYLYTQMVPVSNLPRALTNMGQGYISVIPIPVIIMFVAWGIMWFVVNKTLFGRQAIAMGGNVEAARVCGINVKRTRLGVFAVMGMYAALAGFVLTARNASAQVGAGQGMEMDAIASVVLGGTPMGGGYSYVQKTIIGCLIVGIVTNILNLANVDVNWQEVAKGVLILTAIILDTESAKIKAKLEKKKLAETKKD